MSPWWLRPAQVETISPSAPSRAPRITRILVAALFLLLYAFFALQHVLAIRAHIAGLHRLSTGGLTWEISVTCMWVLFAVLLILRTWPGLSKKRV